MWPQVFWEVLLGQVLKASSKMFDWVLNTSQEPLFDGIYRRATNMEAYVMFYAIWYHLNNLKNVKNTHGGVLFLAKLQAISKCAKCTNGNKSRNASNI